ncbi:MAG: lipopolysaccharide heptosyltransferase II [Vicinamibacterales bacterium]
MNVPGARVLVRMPNWLGDIVMAMPAVGAIRRAFPEGRLIAAGPRFASGLLAMMPGVDEVVALDGGSAWSLVRGTHGDIAALAGARADVAILLTNSFGSALAVRRAGVGERWGYARDGRTWLLTKAVTRAAAATADPGALAGAGEHHHARYYARLVAALGMPVTVADTARLDVTGGPTAAATRALERLGWRPGGRLVGLAPGAAYGQAKRWPPRHVATLVGLLLRDESTACLLVGAPADRETGIAIEEHLRAVHGALSRAPRVINAIGQTSIAELAGLMTLIDVLVSNDSGAMHVASAAGVPVVALFGPTRETETHPLGTHVLLTEDVFCRPCLMRECPIDHRCLTRIAPDRVADAVARVRRPVETRA